MFTLRFRLNRGGPFGSLLSLSLSLILRISRAILSTKYTEAVRKRERERLGEIKEKKKEKNHKDQLSAQRLIWTSLLMHLAIRKWNRAKLLMSQLMRMLVSHLSARARPFQVVFELREREREREREAMHRGKRGIK